MNYYHQIESLRISQRKAYHDFLNQLYKTDNCNSTFITSQKKNCLLYNHNQYDDICSIKKFVSIFKLLFIFYRFYSSETQFLTNKTDLLPVTQRDECFTIYIGFLMLTFFIL